MNSQTELSSLKSEKSVQFKVEVNMNFHHTPLKKLHSTKQSETHEILRWLPQFPSPTCSEVIACQRGELNCCMGKAAGIWHTGEIFTWCVTVLSLHLQFFSIFFKNSNYIFIYLHSVSLFIFYMFACIL